MSDGLTDANWSVQLGDLREKINKLEQEFIEKPSKKTLKKALDELRTYISMKKGFDDYSRPRRGAYKGYLEGPTSDTKFKNYLKSLHEQEAEGKTL